MIVPRRESRVFGGPAGDLFRIASIEGPQVGDLNLWNAGNLAERFFSGKTWALHATHVTTGPRLCTASPYLRPLATIANDTLSWHGYYSDCPSVPADVGTPGCPITNWRLSEADC